MSKLEEEEYKMALAVSQSMANEVNLCINIQDEEISLFDPSTLVKKGKDDFPINKTAINNSNRVQQKQENNISKSIQPIAQNNPTVSSVKKDFDFSHLK